MQSPDAYEPFPEYIDPDAPVLPAPPVTGRRPAPSGWEVLTWVVLAVAVAYVGGAVYRLFAAWDLYRLVSSFVGEPDGNQLDRLTDAVAVNQSAANTFSLLLLAYIAGYITWFYVSRGVVRRHQGSPRLMVHWALVLWRIAIVISLIITLGFDRPASDATEADVLHALIANSRAETLFAVVRVAIGVLIIVGVWSVRGRIRALIAKSPVPPRPAELGVAFQPRLMPALALRASAPESAPRAADDGFWTEVATFVDGHGGEVPMLESWPSGTRRWHLLTAGTIEMVRARLAPGAVLSVYPVAPSADPDAVGREAARLFGASPEPLAGLAEEPGAALFRYNELSTMDEVWVWLERHRGAARLGVYPTAGVPLRAMT